MGNLSKADKALVAGISKLVQNWLSEKFSTVGDALTTTVGAAKKRGRKPGRPKKSKKAGRPKKAKKKAAVKKAAKRGRSKKKAAKPGRPKKSKKAGRPRKAKKKAGVKKAAKRGRPKKKAARKKVAKRTPRGQNLEKIIKVLKTRAKGATQGEIAEVTRIAAPNISSLVKKNAGRFSKTKVGRTVVVRLK